MALLGTCDYSVEKENNPEADTLDTRPTIRSLARTVHIVYVR